jgi:hypothetical protein
MNDTFEKIDFSQINCNDEKISFYSFTRNPIYTGKINFFEAIHLNFNINNILFTTKAEQDEQMKVEEMKEKSESEGKVGMEEINRDEQISIPVENYFAQNEFDNYEDFNDLDRGEGLFTQDNFAIGYNGLPVLTGSKPEDIYNRFGGLAIKQETNKVGSSNIKSEKKKVITKEFFSQQVNSLGNFQDSDNEINQICGSTNITQPDFASYSEEKLKEECKKYGLKPGSKKFMIKQLGDIWIFITTSIFYILSTKFI